jgi:hypothetical protein
MKIKTYIILILIFLPTICLAKDFNFGEVWLKWSKDDSLVWAWGFTNGQELILEELKVKSKDNLKYLNKHKSMYYVYLLRSIPSPDQTSLD